MKVVIALQSWSRWLPALFVALCLTACVTHKIDWNTRVGNYTYDQAVVEMGPPDRAAKLSDGSTVAEWVTARGSSTAYVSGGFAVHDPMYAPYRSGPYGGTAIVTENPPVDYFIRLTFGPQGRLVTWKKSAR